MALPTTEMKFPPNATPEAVALSLLQLVAVAEGKEFTRGYGASADMEWILKAYATCRAAVKGDLTEAEMAIVRFRGAYPKSG